MESVQFICLTKVARACKYKLTFLENNFRKKSISNKNRSEEIEMNILSVKKIYPSVQVLTTMQTKHVVL